MGHTTSHIMKVFVALSALLAVSLADEAQVVASPLAYGGYPYGNLAYGGYAGLPYTAAAAPAYAAYAPYSAGSQFHAQDEFGNLNYSYANINANAHVVGNTYGGVTGGYSYVDANGELQQVQYVADAAGFRV